MRTPKTLQDALHRVGRTLLIEFGNGGYLAELRDPDGSPICCSSMCSSIEGAIRSLEWKLGMLT